MDNYLPHALLGYIRSSLVFWNRRLAHFSGWKWFEWFIQINSLERCSSWSNYVGLSDILRCTLLKQSPGCCSLDASLKAGIRVLDHGRVRMECTHPFILSNTPSFLEIRLRDLHTSLVKTLEEVKVKAPYNEARSLLERYGPTVGMTPHDVAPLTPQSTPMKAKHATTPIPRTKELPQTPTAGSIGTLNTVNTAGPATPATPRSPHTPIRTQQTQLNPQTPTSAGNLHTQTSPARQRSWYDRLADAILGDDPSSLSGDVSQKYALICEKCAKHNGLVPREQYMELRWECRFCQHMNLPPRRKAVTRTALQGDGGGNGGSGSSTHNTHKPSPLSQVNQEEKEKAEQEKDEKNEEKTEQLPAQSNPKPMPKSKS